MRLSVFDLGQGEASELVSILPSEQTQWASAFAKLKEFVETEMSGSDPKLVAASLGMMLRETIGILKEADQTPPTLVTKQRGDD